MGMFSLSDVQAAIREQGVDGWLLYDFRKSNVLAERVLGLDKKTSRRWAYFIPKEGTPRKLVHRIETGVLDALPGDKRIYLKWSEFEEGMAALVAGSKKIAMEYAPRNGNPYISRVDGGTIELIRSFGVEVVSSGDLIQLFESVWDDEQIAMHLEASKVTDAAYVVAWKTIANDINSQGHSDELRVQRAILDHFEAHGVTTYSPPIVGVNAHSGDPHFETGSLPDTIIREGDFVLVDLWGKLDKPRAVYSDLTRTGYVGTSVPEKYTKVFHVVAAARDAAIQYVVDAFAAGRRVEGYEVDDACREVIEKAGYGPYYVHRTGHNIGQEVHGNGAHIDNLETHETRALIPRTCFSIEPGIYLEEFGVRSEVDVLIHPNGRVEVTGGALQTEIVPILAQ
ncbi:peptidase M24 [Planctopirus limnophila DSM 3776]|uniref:Peptidase M24 n=2 Tax=Planctopirus limnophila TaxID=120 RepID=D5SP28_PLAL2|nr:peptidase M24 [Planctopirus limnophila DSM 3776]